MAQAVEIPTGIRVEIGAWVEGSTPKKTGKGMVKVWTTPAPRGETTRLNVIVRTDKRDVHALSLRVDTEDAQSQALEILSLALDALGALPAFAPPAPAPVKAPRTPKAPPVALVPAPRVVTRPPTAGTVVPTPQAKRDLAAVVAAARSAKPAPAPAPAPADDADAWFALLERQAGI